MLTETKAGQEFLKNEEDVALTWGHIFNHSDPKVVAYICCDLDNEEHRMIGFKSKAKKADIEKVLDYLRHGVMTEIMDGYEVKNISMDAGGTRFGMIVFGNVAALVRDHGCIEDYSWFHLKLDYTSEVKKEIAKCTGNSRKTVPLI